MPNFGCLDRDSLGQRSCLVIPKAICTCSKRVQTCCCDGLRPKHPKQAWVSISPSFTIMFAVHPDSALKMGMSGCPWNRTQSLRSFCHGQILQEWRLVLTAVLDSSLIHRSKYPMIPKKKRPLALKHLPNRLHLLAGNLCSLSESPAPSPRLPLAGCGRLDGVSRLRSSRDEDLAFRRRRDLILAVSVPLLFLQLRHRRTTLQMTSIGTRMGRRTRRVSGGKSCSRHGVSTVQGRQSTMHMMCRPK